MSDGIISLEVTLAMVKKQISDEEMAQVTRGDREHTSGELSACDFIIGGINIQDQQYAVPPLLHAFILLTGIQTTAHHQCTGLITNNSSSHTNSETSNGSAHMNPEVR